MDVINRLLESFEPKEDKIDLQIQKDIENVEIDDNHSKECLECGLKTDFIFSDGLCEFCKLELKNKTR